MTDYERPRGVTGYRMPEEIAGPTAMGDYILVIPDRFKDRLLEALKDPSNMTLDEVKNFEVRMVHEEGVGYLVTHDKHWRYSDYSTTVRIWSMWDLLRASELAETVDLADWVSVFGDRLENNFWLQYRWATEEEES